MDEIIKELQTVSKEMQVVDNRISKAVAKEKQLLDKLSERHEALKARLLVAMEENGIKKFENDMLRVTYVAPQIRTSFDTARFKEEAPEIYAEFTKETYTKSHVKISVYETDEDIS